MNIIIGYQSVSNVEEPRYASIIDKKTDASIMGATEYVSIMMILEKGNAFNQKFCLATNNVAYQSNKIESNFKKGYE